MAHLITTHATGLAEMAYMGLPPWHGLGQQMPEGASLEEWQVAAGMNWEIVREPISFHKADPRVWKDRHTLYRSDHLTPLWIVSSKYHVVQPREVLEYFRRLVENLGFELETAGTLQGGRRLWALARTGFDSEVVAQDKVKMYLLLTTSCDTSTKTKSYFTSVRAVCNNTIHLSSLEGNYANLIEISHSQKLDPEAVHKAMGLNPGDVFGDYMNRMRDLASTSMSYEEAASVVERLMKWNGAGDPRENKGFKKIMALFDGEGKGAQLDGVHRTAWGVLNAVTEYADFHARAQSQDKRLTSAWFGAGKRLKENAEKLLINL